MSEETGYSLIGKNLSVSAQLTPQNTLTPTLIIGLGGTGGDVLLRIRKRVFERSKKYSLDEIPIVSYLFIDTDTSDKHIKMEYFEKAYNFNNNERVNATVLGYSRITENLHSYPRIRRWWYPNQSRLPGNDITGGAGQIRGYSRLAFFENYSNIKSAVNDAVSRCRGVEASRRAAEKGLNITNALNIYVIASLAGGTGSGMIIDLGYLLQELNLVQYQTVAFLVFPRIFNINEERIFYNSYATLKELEYFSKKDTSFNDQWEEQTPRNPIIGEPYHQVYLIDGKNEAQQEISGNMSRDSIFEMLAENIFQDFSTSAFANYKRAVRINLSDYLSDKYVYRHRDPKDDTQVLQTEEFPCRYLTFGLATLSFPADRIIKACAYKLAEDIMAFLRSGEKQEDLRKYALERLNKIGLSLGQKNGMLDALCNNRKTQGETFEMKIDRELSEFRDELNDESFWREVGSRAQYLKGKITEKEQCYFREDNPAESYWKDWGEIYKDIHQNKEDLLRSSKEGLKNMVAEIINTENKGIQFAKGVLEEIARILLHPDLPYKPTLDRECQKITGEITKDREIYQSFYEALSRHEDWGIVLPAPFLKGVTIRDDVKKTLENAGILFKDIVERRAIIAALDVIDQLVKFIGKEGEIDVLTSKKEEGSGLIGELDKLDAALDNLSRRYRAQKESFRRPEQNFLSSFVYCPEDLETRFYPKYINPAEMGTYASEVLTNFQYGQEEKEKGISIMGIPIYKDQMGNEAFESEIVRQTGSYFVRIKDDFDVLDMFYNLYKSRDKRKGILIDLYRKSKIWLEQSRTEGAFKLDVSRKRFLIGISTKSPHYTDFCSLVKELQSAGEPPINFNDTDIRHEVIFYNEAGGFPLSYSSSLYALKAEYDKVESLKSLHLHIDKDDSKFKDVMAMSSRERERRELAIKDFLLGVIFNIIKMKEDRDKLMYYYEERVGLKSMPHALGSQHRAIDMLATHDEIRKILEGALEKQRNEIFSDHDKIKKYYALLDWYTSHLYTREATQDASGVPINKAPFEYRIIVEQMLDIEKEITRTSGGIEPFLEEVKTVQNSLDTFTIDVGEGKKAFAL